MIKSLKKNLNKYTIALLIFTITLFGGLSFIFNKDLVDSLINYYIILASGISILILVINNKEEFKIKNLNKITCILTALLLIWIIISAFFGIRLNIETLKGVVNLGCLLVTGLVIMHIKLTKNEKNYILNSIYLSFFISMILGIIQYFSGINLIQYSNELYPGILGRINSTFYIATILDKYIVLIAVLLLYSMVKKPKNFSYKILLLLSGIGISLTFSRGGQLVYVFVLAILFLLSIFKKQIGNILTILLTIIVMLMIPGTSLSFQSGLDFVYNTLNVPNNIRIDISFINNYLIELYSHKDISQDKNNSKLENETSNSNANENNSNTNENNSNTNENNSNANENNSNTTDSNEEGNDHIQNEEPTKEPIINQSLTYRERYKNIGRQLIKDYPVFGIGAGNYSYLFNNQNFGEYITDKTVLNHMATYMYPHSAYIQTAAEIGYIGLTLLCLTIFSYLLYIDFKKNKLLLFTGFMLIFVMLLAGYTEGVFHSKQYIFVFIILLSFLCSKNKQEEIDNRLYKLFDKTYNKTKDEYVKKLKNNLNNNKKTFIVTANPEAFMLAEKDSNYMDMLLDDNTEIIADGIGLVKAGRILGYDIKERIPGVEISEKLLEYANELNKKVYLFGSKEEVIEKMKEYINNKYSNVQIVGAKNGYEKDKDKVFADILKKEPDIVLVALGMPMQEELIYKHIDKFKKGIFMGVGGSFDVLSGTKKRAPKLFIKLNLEWLYRILKEPKRIKRFYNNNVKFVFKVYKIRNNKE